MRVKKTKTPKAQMLSPRQARTNSQIVRLAEEVKETKETWIIVHPDEVTITLQENGKPISEQINIKRRDFNRLIDWYNRPQKARSK